MENLTPMMKQYNQVKEQHKDCILFFRLGDFYEMFFEDAIETSKLLDITLTGRACGNGEKAPMCGVPYHSSKTYIQRLINAGKKVAICEQVQDPKDAKGIVKREIVKIITPATVLEDDMIQASSNNYIMSIIDNLDKQIQENIGLKNVHQRLKLLYGEGLDIKKLYRLSSTS